MSKIVIIFNRVVILVYGFIIPLPFILLKVIDTPCKPSQSAFEESLSMFLQPFAKSISTTPLGKGINIFGYKSIYFFILLIAIAILIIGIVKLRSSNSSGVDAKVFIKYGIISSSVIIFSYMLINFIIDAFSEACPGIVNF